MLQFRRLPVLLFFFVLLATAFASQRWRPKKNPFSQGRLAGQWRRTDWCMGLPRVPLSLSASKANPKGRRGGNDWEAREEEKREERLLFFSFCLSRCSALLPSINRLLLFFLCTHFFSLSGEDLLSEPLKKKKSRVAAACVRERNYWPAVAAVLQTWVLFPSYVYSW